MSETMTMAKALNAGLRRALEADPKVLLVGEDIGKLGGVFRITEHLQRDFGADRVIDSPLGLSGSASFRAEGGADGPLSVKAYGPDAWEGQFLTSTWNSLFLRGETPDLSAGRLPRAEHEALACVMAERAGVGKHVEWDAKAVKCTNLPELNRLVHREYRKGWELVQ